MEYPESKESASETPYSSSEQFDGFGIDGNMAVFEDLVKLLMTEKITGFVGPGASAPLYPLWSRLLESLVNRAAETRRASEKQRSFWFHSASRANYEPGQIAQQVCDALDPGDYAHQMRELFGPRTGGDGSNFTALQRSFAALPFRGFLTTAYDPGLEEACRELRSDRRTISFTRADDQVALWASNQMKADELPVLYAHGRYDQIDSIVFSLNHYREVYGSDNSPYLDLLEHLFTQERLTFLGFGFAQSWLTLTLNRMSALPGIRNAPPPHIAILGIPEDETHNASLHNRIIVDSFRTRVLFYPIRGGCDHSALAELLENLRKQVRPQYIRRPEIPSMPSQSQNSSSLRFKVALSFPGERRDFVEAVASYLTEELGIDRVLYDNNFVAEFARPDLDSYLQNLYRNQSEMIAVFLCEDYQKKDWCRLEWRAMKDLIKARSGDAIMLLRFDMIEISGLFSTDGYVWIGDRKPQEIAELILQRLKGSSESGMVALQALSGRQANGVPESPALKLWEEKLDYLLTQQALVVDPEQKFKLTKDIEEASAKIQQLKGS